MSLSTPSTPIPPTPQTILQTYHASYAHLLQTGQIKPFIWPHHFLGVYIVMLYLLVDHRKRKWLYGARWVVLGVVVWWQVKAVREVRCRGMAVGYGAGLVSAWTVVWAGGLLVWNGVQGGFGRVERRGKGRGRGGEDVDGAAVMGGSGKKSGGKSQRVGDTNGMKVLGTSIPITTGNTAEFQSPEETNIRSRKGIMSLQGSIRKREVMNDSEYYWQFYPEDFWDRLDWILDLSLNFRGPGWNWAIPGLPLPSYITSSLSNHSEIPMTTRLLKDPPSKSYLTTENEYETPSSNSSLTSLFVKSCIGYFTLDILKYLMMLDPYFYTGSTSYPPPTYLPNIITLSPSLTRTYRTLLSFTTILTCLSLVFLSAPLFLRHLLGPRYLGLRGHSFMYPSTWGSFNHVLNEGLPGFWGGWWHQIFRFAFSSPVKYCIRKGWIRKRAITTKILGLVIAFSMSGVMHLCGSVTQFGDTNPSYPLIFFFLQGLGIFIQTSFTSLFTRKQEGKEKRMKGGMQKWIGEAGNFLFVLGWLLITAPWLIDDFARGGLWLFEPLPISFVRGVRGEGWWCWVGGAGVGVYRGERWWESGLALW